MGGHPIHSREKRGKNGILPGQRGKGRAFGWNHQRLLRRLPDAGRPGAWARQGDRWSAGREHRLLAAPAGRGRSGDRQQLVGHHVRQRPQRLPLGLLGRQTSGMS